MSALDELVKEIADENLRRRIEKEVAALKATKKFGLVFEPQNPECTPLYYVAIKKKSLVARKAGKLDEIYKVIAIDGDNVSCVRDKENFTFARADLISVAQFGEPIYPYLKPLDKVCNAPDSPLWHALIEADNYHALQLLKYLYGGKVDCIYIDPPYNTGARDWKYNNDYVDAADNFRHSKWLSMMERRLKLAKELLSDSGAIFISIDDNEQATLKLLCDEIFGASNFVANVAVINNFKGRSDDKYIATAHENLLIYRRKNFISRGVPIPEEYAREYKFEDDNGKYRLQGLRKRGSNSRREDRPNMFYPFFYDEKNGVLSVDELPNSIEILPHLSDGSEGRWRWGIDTARERLGELIVQKVRGREKAIEILPHLSDGSDGCWRWSRDTARERLGELIVQKVKGRGEYDIFQKDYLPKEETRRVKPKSFWMGAEFSSEAGTIITKAILGKGVFSTSKSVQFIKYILQQATSKNSLIVDFFAGSGTTLHAVNLLNAEDGGKRRCILVTNNEVSDAEEKSLRKQGYTPADDAWQRLGVARYVTWPRTVCSIEGHDINGAPLKGNYLGSDLPMADGFKANVAFFKLGFLDKDYVALGRQFKELLPVLWFKAGCRGACPALDETTLPPMLILPANNFAVLLDEKFFSDFEREVLACAAIDTIFIVTDSDYGYHAMIKSFADKTTCQLYRDYLENFKISG